MGNHCFESIPNSDVFVTRVARVPLFLSPLSGDNGEGGPIFIAEMRDLTVSPLKQNSADFVHLGN